MPVKHVHNILSTPEKGETVASADQIIIKSVWTLNRPSALIFKRDNASSKIDNVERHGGAISSTRAG
jgi:hypothetical protein